MKYLLLLVLVISCASSVKSRKGRGVEGSIEVDPIVIDECDNDYKAPTKKHRTYSY